MGQEDIPRTQPNVCDEDDIKRVVYNMKEGIEGKNRNF